MTDKKIDQLNSKNYNLELKYTSKLQLQNKVFILTCLHEFLNNDEQYNNFIKYMDNNRTRTTISNLKVSKTKPTK